MRNVSGVSGATPLLHEIVEHLHGEFGTSWYSQPAGVVERLVGPLTGKLVAEAKPGLVREKFLDGNLPSPESPDDYDREGRVKLGPEYREWLASSQNQLAAEIAPFGSNSGVLRVVSPFPGAVYFLDPDLPASDRLPLKSNAPGPLVWESATLQCAVGPDGTVAQLKGRHQITLRCPTTSATVETWIVVKAL